MQYAFIVTKCMNDIHWKLLQHKYSDFFFQKYILTKDLR